MKGHLLGKLHGELVLAFGLDLHGALLVDLLHVVEHLKELPSMDPRCNVAQAGKHIRDQNGRRPLPTQVHRSHPPTPTHPQLNPTQPTPSNRNPTQPASTYARDFLALVGLVALLHVGTAAMEIAGIRFAPAHRQRTVLLPARRCPVRTRA